MSDSAAPDPRPVSLVTILAIFGCFALFLILIRFAYTSHPPAYIPETEVADKLGDDLKWQATPESRRDYLMDLRAKQDKQATSYGWVDQKNGIVQLPIDRAMELVVRDSGAKQP
jgi:hypothetical protein